MGVDLKKCIDTLSFTLKDAFKNCDICKKLLLKISELLESELILIDNNGNILYEINNKMPSLINDTEMSGERKFEIQVVNQLETVTENKINISFDNLYLNNIDKETLKNVYGLFLPMYIYKQRIGVIIIYRKGKIFEENIDVFAEYILSIFSILIWDQTNFKNSENERKKQNVKACISTLSYSELEAILTVFDELKGGEGFLVASKIADKAGITRSVIVNALRKFESAGVIETRSLGMKGTHIRVLNEYLLPEIEKFKH